MAEIKKNLGQQKSAAAETGGIKKAGQESGKAAETTRPGKPGQESGKNRADEIDELMRFLQPGREVGLAILRALEELPEKYVVLMVANRKKYPVLAEQLIKYFVGKKTEGIFITTNKPAVDLVEGLRKEKVDLGKVNLIDTVSKRSGEGEVDAHNIIYIESPENLTELDSAVNDCIEKVQGKNRFFVLDSMSTLLVYNSERTVEKFMHSLSGKARAKQFKTVFTLASETRQETLNILSQFCDKVIEI
ncbi:MAG: ATPase domain-containing protein [Candidatus Diapherotrites archaeon]|nr:ATPase domain-containing protein [Candidatus Diapherotrites archaeon]